MEDKIKQRQIVGVMGTTFNEEGKLLMTRRHSPSRLELHNKWQFPGGGLEFGESPSETLVREFMEELQIGIKIVHPNPIVISHTWEAVKESEHFVSTQVLLLTYLTKRTDNNTINFEDDPETNAYGWYTHEEINDLDCLPTVKKTAKEIFNLIKLHNYML